jgi:hypothetical protein
LDAIGWLMKFGYQRLELGIPQLREAWGKRLNERVGIKKLSQKAVFLPRFKQDIELLR